MITYKTIDDATGYVISIITRPTELKRSERDAALVKGIRYVKAKPSEVEAVRARNPKRARLDALRGHPLIQAGSDGAAAWIDQNVTADESVKDALKTLSAALFAQCPEL